MRQQPLQRHRSRRRQLPQRSPRQQHPPPAAAAPAPVTAPKPAATGGVTYRIKNGDTLWDIAGTYYRNPWLYPKLAKANSIRNPDLIFAGTRIKIPEN
ncbi:MAG: LysM peptidoglycan-binding domain-containing protein [Spirochaetia bacterium]